MPAPGAAHPSEPLCEQPPKDGEEQAAGVASASILGVGPIGATRLRKHADYQRAYKASRKQFSSSMTYFHAPQPGPHSEQTTSASPRVGITAGRVLGNAVERNRIKRRMRAAIRANQSLLPASIDVILHPRRSVLEMDYAELQREVGGIFSKIASSATPSGSMPLNNRGAENPGKRR